MAIPLALYIRSSSHVAPEDVWTPILWMRCNNPDAHFGIAITTYSWQGSKKSGDTIAAATGFADAAPTGNHEPATITVVNHLGQDSMMEAYQWNGTGNGLVIPGATLPADSTALFHGRGISTLHTIDPFLIRHGASLTFYVKNPSQGGASAIILQGDVK